MAKQRRSVSDPAEEKSKPASQSPSDNTTVTNPTSRRGKILALIITVIVIPCSSVLFYHFKFGLRDIPPTVPQIVEPGGLIKIDVDHQEILREHSNVEENETHRHYTYPILAYVTPWNSKGYEMVKRFSRKFTHISPVWYNLKSQGNELILEGRHNADQGWISDLRNLGDALILPRVVVEAQPKEMLRSKELTQKAIDLIVSECRDMEYDGIVLESWSRWMAYGVLYDPELRNKALEFVKQLGQALHSEKGPKQALKLFYVIAPPYSGNLQAHDFGPEDLMSTKDDVDAFSLMTYDFSGPQNAGPISPFWWIQATLHLLLGNNTDSAHKILVGINYYGNDYVTSGDGGSRAITGREYIATLEKFRPQMEWEEMSMEHLFMYVDDDGSRHVVFYPSLMSLHVRLEEARLQGTGISIWEAGQGLDYFFHLL